MRVHLFSLLCVRYGTVVSNETIIVLKELSKLFIYLAKSTRARIEECLAE